MASYQYSQVMQGRPVSFHYFTLLDGCYLIQCAIDVQQDATKCQKW